MRREVLILLIVVIVVVLFAVLLNSNVGKHHHHGHHHHHREKSPVRKASRQLVSYDDFKNYQDGVSYPFFSPATNDATVTVNPTTGGIKFNETPQAFVATVPQGPVGTLDHVKWLGYWRKGDAVVPGADYKSFTAPSDGRWLIIKASGVGADQYYSAPVPPDVAYCLRDQYQDPRPCCAAFAILDPVNLLTCDFLITRKRVYAIYERLPFLKPGWPIPPVYQGPNLISAGDYHGFTHIVPIFERDQNVAPLEEDLDLEFRYNKVKGVLEWWVNGVRRLEWTRIGAGMDRQYRALDHNGPDVRITPDGFCAGFGLFSLLDCHDTNEDQTSDPAPVQLCSPSVEYVNPKLDLSYPFGQAILDTTFIDTTSAAGNRIFGQGVQFNIKALSVYHGE